MMNPTAAPVVVRDMVPGDWARVAEIYGAGIRGGNATFETEVPAWEAWDRGHRPRPRLVAESDGRVVGWAAVSPESHRSVYRGVAEHSIYVDPAMQRQGIGRRLLTALIDAAEAEGIWTLHSGIFPENESSLALHTACGFRVVGRRERFGRMPGRGWRDVLLVERRSTEVGID